MRWSSMLRLRLRSLFSRKRVDAELEEEMRYHLDREIELQIAAGKTPVEARFAALRSIAGFEQRKQECRDARRVNLISNFEQDVHYTIRQLRKNPSFTVTVILVLALGVAASIAIFSFVDAALLKPLPYYDPARLV